MDRDSLWGLLIIAVIWFSGFVIGRWIFRPDTEHDFKTYSVSSNLTYRLGRNTGCVNIDGREFKFFFQEMNSGILK